MIGFICIFCILFGPTWAQFGRAFTSSIFIIISENPTGMDGSSVVQLSWDWKGQSVTSGSLARPNWTCNLFVGAAELDVQLVRWPNWTCNLFVGAAELDVQLVRWRARTGCATCYRLVFPIP